MTLGDAFLGRNAPFRRGSVTVSQLCTMLPSHARSKWSAADFFSVPDARGYVGSYRTCAINAF